MTLKTYNDRKKRKVYEAIRYEVDRLSGKLKPILELAMALSKIDKNGQLIFVDANIGEPHYTLADDTDRIYMNGEEFVRHLYENPLYRPLFAKKPGFKLYRRTEIFNGRRRVTFQRQVSPAEKLKIDKAFDELDKSMKAMNL